MQKDQATHNTGKKTNIEGSRYNKNIVYVLVTGHIHIIQNRRNGVSNLRIVRALSHCRLITLFKDSNAR